LTDCEKLHIILDGRFRPNTTIDDLRGLSFPGKPPHRASPTLTELDFKQNLPEYLGRKRLKSRRLDGKKRVPARWQKMSPG